MKYTVEICCGSYEDCISAQKGNANRIELTTALFMGGLSASVAALTLAKKSVTIPIMCMVRPRGGAFHYSQCDFEVMLLETKQLLDAGADGIVFGFLNSDASLDIERTKQILAIIGYKQSVFHRAFDLVEDPYKTIEQCINLGITRILTSGQQAKAIDGVDLIKDLQTKYGDKIQILVGSGVNNTNVKDIIDLTNVTQVHSSCKDWVADKSNTVNKNINYGYEKYPYEHCYDVVCNKKVASLVHLVNELN